MAGSVREVRPGRWELRMYVGRDVLTGRKRYRSRTVSANSEEEARVQLLDLGDDVTLDRRHFDLIKAKATSTLTRRLAGFGLSEHLVQRLMTDVLAEFHDEVVAATRSLDSAAARVAAGGMFDDDFDPRGFFVYLLRGDEGQVLYVGQSTNILGRLGAHLGDSDKHAHVRRVSLIRCLDAATMNTTEWQLIRRHQPPWNIVGVANPVASDGTPRPRGRGRGPTTDGPGLATSVGTAG
jgi:hypothetical protein